ncbi:hypothetical protein K505DRAFT_326604 [Melanomma pulvis-pyrius CBS 109.77]|uniref:Uncharacterized protein n=1 Tax=Melanomma pulvis-pyrius CBS 109.77 TaxID=1314802 RepID=A0A6A6X695_9PLEO|nr:hypothetical protein K505DRAFT_326604 [Melanomma pulvis-pyrius CBS 109.77]
MLEALSCSPLTFQRLGLLLSLPAASKINPTNSFSGNRRNFAKSLVLGKMLRINAPQDNVRNTYKIESTRHRIHPMRVLDEFDSLIYLPDRWGCAIRSGPIVCTAPALKSPRISLQGDHSAKIRSSSICNPRGKKHSPGGVRDVC